MNPATYLSASETLTVPKKLLVFGASGPTGRRVVQHAVDQGHEVVAATRRPEEFQVRHPSIKVARADLLDAAAVTAAMSKVNAVISTFGVPYSFKAVSIYSAGMSNIVRAMQTYDVQRLVCVSSTGVSNRPVPGETLIWRHLVMPFFRHVLGRSVYTDMRRMENIVRESGLCWTILRPAALFDTQAPTADYQVHHERLAGRMTSRADLAQCLVQEAVAAQHPSQVVDIVSPSLQPSYGRFLFDTFLRRKY